MQEQEQEPGGTRLSPPLGIDVPGMQALMDSKNRFFGLLAMNEERLSENPNPARAGFAVMNANVTAAQQDALIEHMMCKLNGTNPIQNSQIF